MSKKEQIIAEIRKIYDPELPVNIYELGLIYDIQVHYMTISKTYYEKYGIVVRIGDVTNSPFKFNIDIDILRVSGTCIF